MIFSDKEILDIDEVRVFTLNSLRRFNIRNIEQIQKLGRDKFIKDGRFTYSVRLEILNYLHKNGLYFYDDVVPSK